MKGLQENCFGEEKHRQGLIAAVNALSKLEHLTLVGLPFTFSFNEFRFNMSTLKYLHIEPIAGKVDEIKNLLESSPKLRYLQLVIKTGDQESLNSIEQVLREHKARNPDFNYFLIHFYYPINNHNM